MTTTAEHRPMDFRALKNAIEGAAAALRCRTRLQPDGGDGAKVFPPTYAGGVYAVENRRIEGNVVRCVLLDSVQSQANRFEELLLDAVLPSWREAECDGLSTTCDLPILAVFVENHGWITSLTAPHRVHDAILRDSEIEDGDNREKTRFRESQIGQAIVKARVHNATAFYRYCPTALLFGTWDSTAGEGLDSAKVPRAVVSEIVGVDITPGVRTGSRVDPLGIKAGSATIYRRRDGGWALQDQAGNWVGATGNEIEQDQNGNPKKFGKGKPSDINHGNVTPDLARFGDRREIKKQHLDILPDLLSDDASPTKIKEHAVKTGGVTMAYALHTWTLSLTQLRRLRFPSLSTGTADASNDARIALAALALYALALQHERGCWLRSRCELIPEGQVTLELVGTQGGGPFALPSAKEIRENLLRPAVEKATWEKRVYHLTPSAKLVELVKRSDAMGASEEAEDNETGTDSNS